MITVYWKVIIETWIFLLIINVKISKIFFHFVKVLFHLLFVVVSRNVLRSLIYILGCLPSKIWTFWWKLTKLLSVILSFILFWVESCMISLWSLWGFKKVLLWSWRLDVHFVCKTLWHISRLIIIWSLLILG